MNEDNEIISVTEVKQLENEGKIKLMNLTKLDKHPKQINKTEGNKKDEKIFKKKK